MVSGMQEVQIAIRETSMMTSNKYLIRITGQDATWGFSNYTEIDLIISCDSVTITETSSGLAYEYTVGAPAI
jgi:hypothetical protein